MSIKTIPSFVIVCFLSALASSNEYKLGGYIPGDNTSKVGKFLNLTMKCDSKGTNVNSPSPDLSVCTKNDGVIIYQFSKDYLHDTGFTEIVAVVINDTLIYLNYVVDLNSEKNSEAERVSAVLETIYGAPDKSGYFKYQGNLNMEKVDFIQIWNNSKGVSTQVELKTSIFGKLLVVKSRLVAACEKYPNHCETIKNL